MALSGLEQLLIGAGLTLTSGAVSGAVVWMKTAKDKVGYDECIRNREKIEEEHRIRCPENRRVLSVDDHESICSKNLTPIHREIKETKMTIAQIHEKIDRLLVEQSKHVTLKDLEPLLRR
jgi:hypothetical protein